MRKIEIKAGWEGLSICVVLEEKFEHRLQKYNHTKILDRILQIKPIGNASFICKMWIFVSNKHDTFLRKIVQFLGLMYLSKIKLKKSST